VAIEYMKPLYWALTFALRPVMHYTRTNALQPVTAQN
jgi:hypothetical protein